jgi:hypothetical protein
MSTGQGKPDPEQVTRYVELERSTLGWVKLRIVDGEDVASIHVPMHQIREAKRFAELVSKAGELVFRTDYRPKG